jgi:hypothetical protein
VEPLDSQIYPTNFNFEKETASGNMPFALIVVQKDCGTVHKYFPFFSDVNGEGDLNILSTVLQRALNKDPYLTTKYVKYALARRTESVRNAIFIRGINMEPLISNSDALVRVLRRLTMEHVQATLYDMELVYHSCRNESAVTRECIRSLRRQWQNAPSEAVWLKILSVLDRIIDPVILQCGGSGSGKVPCDFLIKWLEDIEEKISPFKRYTIVIIFGKFKFNMIIFLISSPEALRMTKVLLIRCKEITKQFLPVCYNLKKEFDDIDSLEVYRCPSLRREA